MKIKGNNVEFYGLTISLQSIMSFWIGFCFGGMFCLLLIHLIFITAGIIVETKQREPYKIEINGTDTLYYFKGK